MTGPGRGPARGAGGPNRPPDPRRHPPRSHEDVRDVREDADSIPRFLDEALRLQELGALRQAMEAAGEAVRRAPERPDGYALLGELTLADGDAAEARRLFTAARDRSAAVLTPGEGDAATMRLRATIGLAHVARIEGDKPAEVAAWSAALALDAGDPLGVRGPLCEALLAGGRAADALAVAAQIDDCVADHHFTAAVAAVIVGDHTVAGVRMRRALMDNLYLLSAVLDSEPPTTGLVHGVEEATPEYAAAAAERLRAIIDAESAAVEWLVALAATPTVMAEVGAFVAAALRLRHEADATTRTALHRELARLRDPARLRATLHAVLAEMDPDAPFAV